MDAIDIAVVGGGIAGVSAAYHLARATSHDVTVFERSEVGGETTDKSAAFFGFYGSDLERRLKRYGMATYNEFLSDPAAAPRHDLVGRLRVATTRDGADSLGPTTGGTVRLDGEELQERVLVPELDVDAIAAARYRPHVGFHRPRELALEFAARARAEGATIETGATVDDVATADGQVVGLTVDGERVDASAVVCAAGPWNPRVAASAGVDLPVDHSLAPILVLERDDHAGHTLPIVTHVESGAYARGDEGGRVLVGHHPTAAPSGQLDPGEVGDTVPADLRAEMVSFVETALPALADAEIVDEWVGVRSHTPDGHPIAGWTGVRGFSVAAFNSSGIQLSPAVGRLIARQLAAGDPTAEHDGLSISRFEGYDDEPFSLGAD